MSLIAGVRLGPYEIQSAIGAGGMGEVYKARDTRLDRTVAIKVLPAHVASDPNLRERFEREARAVAGLNHPHICTLHDVGQQDGVDFLVMEYLEGQTLADRLTKGALPLDQSLQYAIQIADALDKAHRAGITHRDLKPANIILTKSGAKLLDFGLAKLKQVGSPAAALSGFRTGDDTITAEGTLLGTLQYMSPEQVEGKEADSRSDIFAFGAVVYEMATGKRAFEGKSQAGVMAKILEHDPPPMSTVQAMTPPALDRVVRTCLEKDPDERWQTAHDVRKQLKWIAEGGLEVTPLTTASTKGSGPLRRGAVRWIPGFMVLIAVSGLAIWSLSIRRSAPPSVSRFTIALPPHERLPVLQSATGGTQSWLAISRDGRHLAYVATLGSIYQLYLRAIDSLEARPISGTEGAVAPFFSPDGHWIGFFADGKMKKVSVTGGAAITLADAPGARGATWGSQGTIVFAPTAASVLFQVPDEGGSPRPLTQMAQGETSHGDPQFLPGGNAVLFTARGQLGGAADKVAVQLIETGERRNLLQAGTSPGYASSGHLLYSQGQTLMAVPFDPQRLVIVGAAVPVVEGILKYANIGAAQYGISATGSLVYISTGVQGIQRKLVWVSRNGAQQPLAAPPRAYDWPQLSPDGRRIAVEIADQLWLYDLDRDTLTPFTFDGSTNIAPTWTPDGKRIAFLSNREGPSPKEGIFWQLADGSGGLERLTSSKYREMPRSWSPDGQLLAFHESGPTLRDIWVLRLSDRKPQLFLRTPFQEGAPAFSADGRWLTYVSNESGRPEIYVRPYPGPGGKWQISTEGGTEPVWNRNGRELFYRSGTRLMAVEVATQPTFSAGRPRLLFEGMYLASLFPLTGVAYDVSPDGQRFLMVQEAEQSPSATQINVVLDWFEELKRRVPSAK